MTRLYLLQDSPMLGMCLRLELTKLGFCLGIFFRENFGQIVSKKDTLKPKIRGRYILGSVVGRRCG